jgi:hypothetical protein
MQLWNATLYMYGDGTTVRNNHSLDDGVDSNNSMLWTSRKRKYNLSIIRDRFTKDIADRVTLWRRLWKEGNLFATLS